MNFINRLVIMTMKRAQFYERHAWRKNSNDDISDPLLVLYNTTTLTTLHFTNSIGKTNFPKLQTNQNVFRKIISFTMDKVQL